MFSQIYDLCEMKISFNSKDFILIGSLKHNFEIKKSGIRKIITEFKYLTSISKGLQEMNLSSTQRECNQRDYELIAE